MESNLILPYLFYFALGYSHIIVLLPGFLSLALLFFQSRRYRESSNPSRKKLLDFIFAVPMLAGYAGYGIALVITNQHAGGQSSGNLGVILAVPSFLLVFGGCIIFMTRILMTKNN